MSNVLITGGTSGIGLALAEKFASRGYGLALAASETERLKEVKENLEMKYHVPVTVFPFNLAKMGAARELYHRIDQKGIKISILVNNAGIGCIGPIQEIDFRREEDMMILNMVTLTQLCRLFLKNMYKNGSGKILNVSSTGAFQPGPYTSSYYACKSYVLSYSRAIRREAAEHGVQVCALCPGTTDTGFFKKAGKPVPSYAASPKAVAEYAFQKLMRDKEIIVPGLLNRLLRIVPVRIKMYAVMKLKRK